MTRLFAVVRGCTFCGTCVLACPKKAIELTDKGAQIMPERCAGCGKCYDNCASEAIAPVEIVSGGKSAK